MKRTLAGVIILTMCLLLCACGNTAVPTEAPTAAPTEAPTEPPEPTVSPEELARREAYHEKMAAVFAEKLEGVIPYEERWQFAKKIKVVEVVEKAEKPLEYGERVFTDTHIDPKWVAEEPEDVRFVVKCTYGVSEKGWYPIGGGKAYQHYVAVEIKDLAVSAQFEKMVFHGSEPPETVSEPGDHYGSKVDEAEIRAWINSVIEEKAPECVAEVVEEVRDTLDLLDTSSRSYVLEFIQENEGYSSEFSDEAIEYALDLCGVDWKEHALLKALEKLADQPSDLFGYYSYHYTVKCLTDTWGFTQEEAVYAADNCGTDWKEQCCLQVKLYLEDDVTYNDTREWMTEELKDYGLFTDEEIKYALEQCGVK